MAYQYPRGASSENGLTILHLVLRISQFSCFCIVFVKQTIVCRKYGCCFCSTENAVILHYIKFVS